MISLDKELERIRWLTTTRDDQTVAAFQFLDGPYKKNCRFVPQRQLLNSSLVLCKSSLKCCKSAISVFSGYFSGKEHYPVYQL